MDPQTIGTLIKQAADIAETVPETLRGAAFQRALDALLGQTPAVTRDEASIRAPRAGTRKVVGQGQNERGGHSAPVTTLLEVLDRTELAPLLRGRKVLDRALLVLRAAEVHNIDALTPADIAGVLTQKFREPTTASAVRMALDRSPAYTDRRPTGASFVYTLMAPGEAYLDGLSQQPTAPSTAKRRAKAQRSRKGRSAAPNKPASSVAGREQQPAPRTKRVANSGRPGPKAALESLKEEGFFSKPRVMTEILAHLEETKTYIYRTSDMTATLQRLVRQGSLTRSRNADSQFQYIAK